MNYERMMLILKEKDVLPTVRFMSHNFLRYGWCKIRSHQHKQESFPHFISKAIIGKLILNQGDGMFTEYEYPDCQVADVLQIKGKELIAYQIETNAFKEKKFMATDTIVIDLRKAPKNVMEAFDILKKYFKEFII